MNAIIAISYDRKNFKYTQIKSRGEKGYLGRILFKYHNCDHVLNMMIESGYIKKINNSGDYESTHNNKYYETDEEKMFKYARSQQTEIIYLFDLKENMWYMYNIFVGRFKLLRDEI